MSARKVEALPLPEFLRPKTHIEGPVLAARDMVKSFGGIKAVQGINISIADRTLHALIGPNGAGKTSAFNLLSGMFPPDEGEATLMGKPIAGHSPEEIAEAGIGRSFQITNLFPELSVGENIRLAVQARHPRRFDPFTNALSIDAINRETDEVIRYLGLAGIEKAQAGALSLRRPAVTRHGRRSCNRAARVAARRAARRTGCRRARAHRRDHQAHIFRPAGTAGGARYRPGVRARRPCDRDE